MSNIQRDKKIKAAKENANKIINVIDKLHVNPSVDGTLKNVEDIIKSKDVVKEDYDSVIANIAKIKSTNNPIEKAKAAKAIADKLTVYLDRSIDAFKEAKKEVPNDIKDWKKAQAKLETMWKEGHKAEAIKAGAKAFGVFLTDLFNDAIADPISDTLFGESKEEQDEEATRENAVEVPAVEVPVVEIPAVEVPVVEVPAVEVPAVEVPVVEVPVAEVPVAEVPVVEVPVVEVPVVEVPVVEVPVVEVPVVEVPVVEVPVVEVPTELPVEPAAEDLPLVAEPTHNDEL